MSQDLHLPAYRTRLGNLTAKSVLALIADQVNVDGLGWPSVDYIVRMTEIDRRTVRRMLDVFHAMELVVPGPPVERFGKMVPTLQMNLAKLSMDLTEEFVLAYAKLQGKEAEQTNGRWRLITRRKPVSEVSAPAVSEVIASVSETGCPVSEVNKSVSEVKPPHPLIGRPVIDPLSDPLETQSACAGQSGDVFSPEQQEHLDRLAAGGRPDAQWRRYYAEENRKAAEERAEEASKEAELRRDYPDLEAALTRMRKRCGFAWSKGDELEPVLRQVFADQEDMGKPVWRTAAQMVSAWELQRVQGPRLRARYGPLKFYRDGHWLSSAGWHWNTELLERQAGASAGSRSG